MASKYLLKYSLYHADLVLWNIVKYIINNEVKIATIVMMEDSCSLYNLSTLCT